MQAGTISRLRFRGRSWGLKIYFGWNIVHFRKSYICSNKLDVQETNFSFTQFNRIKNHLFGWRIEVRWYARFWSMGSDRSSSWKHDSEPYRSVRPVVEQTWSLFSPMMNLVSRCSETTPDVLPSTASESPGKTRHESQSPLSPQTEQHYRTGRPVVYAYSSSYSEWNVDKTWSSQEWKSDVLMEVKTGRPVVTAQRTDRFIVENDKMNSYTEAESEMSLESRSFLHRVNDQVRKRQNQSSKDATKDSDNHSVIWGMFMSSVLEASVFMWKNYSDNWHSIKNTKDLTMKQMFDISEKLRTEQSDEIYGISSINCEHSSWKYWSLVGDEQVVSLLHAKVYVFSDSVLCLGKVNENPKSNIAWEDRLNWFKSSQEYMALDRIDGEPMEFEWNIFPGFTTLELCTKVQELLLRLNETPENFTGRIIFMSMLNDISWGSKDNKIECESNAQLVSLYAKRCEAGQWSFLGPGSEQKWWPGGWGPQGMSPTGGGGLARVPNLRVCNHLFFLGVAHAGVEGWINILPWYRPVGVAKKSSETHKEEEPGLPEKSKWPPRGTGTTVLTYPCPSQPCFCGSKGCARVTGKAGENGQYSGVGRHLTLDKTVGSRVWWHPKALASFGLI